MSGMLAPTNAAMQGSLEIVRSDMRPAGGRGRLRAGFAIPALVVAGIALLVLSCGDDAVGPTTPPTPPPPPAPVATTVTVNPGAASFTALGETARFTAEVRDQNGQVMAGAAVAWASSDASVATADASGEVTAAGNGTATITATSGSASGTAEVTVAQEVSAVVVSPAAATLVAFGDTVRLAAEATDANGHGVAGLDISWSSSDVGVARVDETGLVEAVAEGTATITATVGETSGTAEITTVENPERSALVALYEATDGPNWVDNTNWLTDAPLGEWYGVETNDSDRVVRLDLGGKWEGQTQTPHGLRGPIPPELGNLVKLEVLNLGINSLTGTIPPELASLANLERLGLADNDLSGQIPPELGQLGNLLQLQLGANDLHGTIPTELGALTKLRDLHLTFNRLTGRIPTQLGNLDDLRALHLGFNNLAGRIPSELGNLSSLRRLFLNVNGLTGPIPPELGNLTELQQPWLSVNRLAGPIPPELGNLSELRWLRLFRNRLTGRVPPELGGLHELEVLLLSTNALGGPLPPELTDLSKLRELSLHGTELCVPKTQAFRDWLAGVEVRGGHEDCEVVHTSHREMLKVFFEASGGDGWLVNTNWLSDAPLDDWYGVTADSEDMVTAIALSGNGLSGVLPLEIGFMATLGELLVNGNAALRGELPREMTYLSELTSARFDGTDLCIPTTARFRVWVANAGDLRGAECPDDHGDEPEFATPILIGAAVDAELETAEDEDWFRFELGGRGTLSVAAEGTTVVAGELYDTDGSLLGYDGLFGSFSIVRRLPPGTYYVRVVGGTEETRGAYELVSSFEPRTPGARAYLTQAVQSHDFAVPLVAGEDALLRVFVMADDGVTASRPPVRATFYQGGSEVHSAVIDGSSARVPHTMAEDDLVATANTVVPGSVIAPGTEMVIEVDPDGTLDPSLGIGGRIPAEGRMALDIREVPDFDVTAVPFLWTENPDSSGYKVAVELTAEHELFYETRDWLPVADLQVSVRDAVLVDYDPTENMDRVVGDVALVHAADGASGYYMGVPPWIESGTLGIAFVGGRASVSRLDGHTIAHEFGHNFSLNHAPCGNPAIVDGRYPHIGGNIGAWGYDFTDGTLVDPEVFTDLMTYCRTNDWVSDYSFAKAADHRTGAAAAMASRGARRVLVVRGGVRGGRLRIEPAFVLDAPPKLPERAGPHGLVGSDAQGRELFTLRFGMQEIADVDVEGDGGFTFAIPVQTGWAEALATITLSGPEGSVTMPSDDPASPATALILDAATGRIRAILRDPPSATQAAAVVAGGAGGAGLEVLISRGIPDTDA